MPAHYSFSRFAVETMGTFGEDALQLFKELGGRIQAQSGDTRATSFLLQETQHCYSTMECRKYPRHHPQISKSRGNAIPDHASHLVCILTTELNKRGLQSKGNFGANN